MGTSQARSSAGKLARRAEGYDMLWGQCNGHDLYEVRACMDKHLTLAASSRGRQPSRSTPTATAAHSVADPDNTYAANRRSRNTERRRTRSRSFSRKLLDEGVLDAALIEKIDTEARAEADNAPTSPRRARSPPSTTSRRMFTGSPTTPPSANRRAGCSSTEFSPANHAIHANYDPMKPVPELIRVPFA